MLPWYGETRVDFILFLKSMLRNLIYLTSLSCGSTWGDSEVLNVELPGEGSTPWVYSVYSGVSSALRHVYPVSHTRHVWHAHRRPNDSSIDTSNDQEYTLWRLNVCDLMATHPMILDFHTLGQRRLSTLISNIGHSGSDLVDVRHDVAQCTRNFSRQPKLVEKPLGANWVAMKGIFE